MSTACEVLAIARESKATAGCGTAGALLSLAGAIGLRSAAPSFDVAASAAPAAVGAAIGDAGATLGAATDRCSPAANAAAGSWFDDGVSAMSSAGPCGAASARDFASGAPAAFLASSVSDIAADASFVAVAGWTASAMIGATAVATAVASAMTLHADAVADATFRSAGLSTGASTSATGAACSTAALAAVAGMTDASIR
ncbi:hypothetical protein [Burkholderia oklahomensis]|uniref:hypothetical protein n=1 Tax=Burkholderia oklahomensis TaxID=342113 RepID=UPI000D36876A